MTREELLEFAALDAFGLLDEYEAALYTRSFHQAPPAIQEQIIQLQAQLVTDESLLPSEPPDPSLRDRVLNAVSTAIERETAQLEPLATIGRGRNPAAGGMALATGSSGQLWRAASFALFAGLIVVAYFLAQLSSQHNQIARIALTNNTDTQLEALIGPTFKDFLFDASAKRILFKPTTADSKLRAVMYVAENAEQAFVVVEGLTPSTQPYLLQLKDASGNTEVVQKFEVTNKLAGLRVAISSVAARLQNATWEISGPNGSLLTSI